MAEKVLRTKIALLYKSYAEWDSIKDSYIPLKGEVCICEVPAETGAVVNEPAVLIKVGDGVKAFAQLPWLSGLAADIYQWSKKENLEWSDMTDEFKQGILDLIGGEETNTLYQIVADGEGAWKLQKSEDKGATWVDAVGRIDINDLLAKKVDKRLEGDNGVAEIFNEKDGGGAHFIHNDGSESFVGVNDGGKDGMMAQIYADIKEDGAWVGSRINVYHNGIYYVSKAAQKAGAAKDAADREIATIADIKALGKVLRFRGIFNSLDEVTNPEHGDVAIVGNKEYIYVIQGGVAEWKEFGDVSEYATKAEFDAEVARAKAAEEANAAAITAEAARAKAAEKAIDAKVDALDDSLAAIAKTGNVNDLIQSEGDILILNCNE